MLHPLLSTRLGDNLSSSKTEFYGSAFIFELPTLGDSLIKSIWPIVEEEILFLLESESTASLRYGNKNGAIS